MSGPICQTMQLLSKVICDLPAGHSGSHMHFGPNGTTAWGFGYALASWQEPT